MYRYVTKTTNCLNFQVRMEETCEEMRSKPPPYAYVETNETKPLINKGNVDADSNGIGSRHQSFNRDKHVIQ